MIISAKTRREIDWTSTKSGVARLVATQGESGVRGKSDDPGSCFTRGDPTTRVKAQEVYATRRAAIGGKRNIAPISGGQGKIVGRTR